MSIATEDEKRQAHEALEAAIRKVAELEECGGILVDWVVPAALQTFDEDGHCPAAVVKLLPYDGFPYYRLMGLIDYAHAGLHNAITDETQIDGLD